MPVCSATHAAGKNRRIIADKTIAYLFTDIGIPSANKVAYSKDNGASFTLIHSFSTSNSNFSSMCAGYDATTAYILTNFDELWVFEDDNVTQLTTGLNFQGNSVQQVEMCMTSNDTVLYVCTDQSHLFRSDDAGLNFNQLPDLPENTWDVGIGTSTNNPNAVFFGEMELYRSLDGGNNFNKVSDWWEYYSDVPNKIHADIMDIQSFQTSAGTNFTLIPNHGGVSISWDYLTTTENIGMVDLNVGEFYDVATSPINSSLIMGGTQDQGLLRTLNGAVNTTVSFEQVISGDYGEQQFTNNGTSFWTQYPGADFSYYADAQFDAGPLYWQTVDGSDLPAYGWIVPTGASPDPSDDYILVAGGNILGGGGSYLVKLENQGGAPNLSQFPFDFRAASGANIGAIETTPLNPDRWYVATENGNFYISDDAGDNWTVSEQVPSASWIFTADIFASRLDSNLVFAAGTNYQGAPVHISTDGGQTFDPIGNGIPNTAVYEMCMDPNEEFLFAASDAGPYIYVIAEDEWYYLGGTVAPLQPYISCEFVEVDNLVRFATHGRGIWDFAIADLTGIEKQETDLNTLVYPNPSDGQMTVKAEDYSVAKVFNLNGQEVVQTALIPGSNKLNISFLRKGAYLMIITDKHGRMSREKIVIE